MLVSVRMASQQYQKSTSSDVNLQTSTSRSDVNVKTVLSAKSVCACVQQHVSSLSGMECSKSVLVCIAEHRHVVCFSGDLNDLKIKVKEAFGDMIPDGANFFFQVKHEGWGGQFVDTESEKDICHKSVLKVVMENEVFTIPFVIAVQLCSFSLIFIVLCHIYYYYYNIG